MTVNNGSNLSKEYFISYLKLVMEARSYSLEQAKTYMFNNFFKSSKEVYGKESYCNFLLAIEKLKEGRVLQSIQS
ncbi:MULTISPECIES: hypothetical protein [Bacillaceae]|uniref:hypothetical protein n=1 Tax=Bacillaceae TaxID=186817 RepID=UPI0006AFA9B5|nr:MULTISPECIES: hypothetical protein [Bacillaceae]ALC85583.1 hypothetical protein AM499_06920 [Bacillus sp. FJAT-22090]KQL35940.1 hypothetical protein AN959_08650 [Psychrobacillus sp. FJAT-21963]